LLDIGSGNGSPGLVLGLLRPDLRVTLLEPRVKRWAFLREAARAAGRADIEVLRERHHQYQGPQADNLTLRGLAVPLDELLPSLTSDGQILVFGPVRAAGPGLHVEVFGEGRARIHRLRRRST